MRFPAVIPVALAVALIAGLLAATPVLAQDWAPLTFKDDGFRAAFPGQPKIETTTYTTEFRMTLPARVYRASDPLGRYSTTVVDYRNAERMHDERAAACRAAKGANQRDGDSCQNDYVLEVAGAMDHAVSHYLKRDGVKVTQYGLYFLEVVSGRLLHLTNPDQSRTNVAVHQHAGRLYIHEATVPAGMPEPLLFMQSLAWVNGQGLAIRYRTLYTEGYADWKFPQPVPPPFTLRDLETSIDQPPRPAR
jgi:hypothetical protein